MTVIPWRRSRAEQQARALHPSAASTASGRGTSPAVFTGRTAAATDPGSVAGASDSVVQLWSDDQCRRYLRVSGEGRLSYVTGRGPVALVVPYIASGSGSLLIPVAPFNEARQYVPGQLVTLEVSGSSPDFVEWVVRVTGTAGESLLFAGARWGSGYRTLTAGAAPVPALDNGELAVLELPLSHVRGFGIAAPAAARAVRGSQR